MGIVINQSIKNTITTYLGFFIGAINTLFLYTNFLSKDYFGLVVFILSTANIMMPFLMFGVSNSLVKFYSSYKTRKQQNSFLVLMLFLPLLIIIPLGLIGTLSYEIISHWLSKKNVIIKEYTWTIYVIAIAMAYFEVFFSWSKVHLKSVFGNFMKEVFHRIAVLIALLMVYYNFITVEVFIYTLVVIYVLRMLIMKIYAFSIRFPKFSFQFSFKASPVLKYSLLIIIAGSVAMLMLDLDKSMLGQLIVIDNVADYSVATFIAIVIAVPARAMHQITYPLTASYLNNNDTASLNDLYKKSSINLFIIGGLIFVLIITNINMLYALLPEAYNKGLYVVIIISVVKLMDNLLGNNNAILFNSNYYRVILIFGVIVIILAVVLNLILIPKWNILGAALATLISFFIYNILKLWYVKHKFNIQPFTIQTFKVLLLIIALCFVFYFWEFSFHPIANIALKGLLVSVFYGGVVYAFNLSKDISALIKKIVKL